jgi:cytochrome oxidase Cu insertion factor (SCO1/SenC/PrrC family)
MRSRLAVFAMLAVLVLAVAACAGDPPSAQGAGGPATTAAGPEPTTAPTATRKAAPETTRQAPQGLIPADRRQPAPDLRVTDFDGRTVTLGGFRGQPVVVNFFESW